MRLHRGRFGKLCDCPVCKAKTKKRIKACKEVAKDLERFRMKRGKGGIFGRL